jgi:abortive infection bacteriophage resistance protein
MSIRYYKKQPMQFSDQLVLLKQRGLNTNDDKRVVNYLQQISYYRLSAYFLPYQLQKDKFNNDISFDHILDTYLFDRDLRLLVFDTIERIEVAIRTQFVYTMAMTYNNSHWHDDKSLFKPPYKNYQGYYVDPYNDFQKIISKAIDTKNPEVFIKHYINKYDSPKNPPSWMSIELLTVGELSRIYNGLAKNSDKQKIADFFGLHRNTFKSWLHSLTYVRNICAHHSRLWNREFAIRPEILKKPKFPWIDSIYNNNGRIFYFLCTVQYLLNRANPQNSLRIKLNTLFNKYPTVPIRFIGLPSDKDGKIADWDSQPIWK